MRVSGVPAVTAAVLGLVLLTGCQGDDLKGSKPVKSPAASASAVDPTTAPARPGATDSGKASPSASAAPSGPVRQVIDASMAGGLSKVSGKNPARDVDPGEMRDGMNLVSAAYSDWGSDDAVLVVAVDHVPEATTKRREHLWRGMLEHIEWDFGQGVPEAQPVSDPGPLGGSVECLSASLAENGNVICGWADATTAGVALFPNSTVMSASMEFMTMRVDLEK
ncbi:hypothetical protein [Streptomyces sp. H51]|uniref:hypothetical protein n=1 Tax=Streptomyces sp. H51 TaxID=3111770 RepID=UPI002D79F286|nr:hypothetical protein [Streptomyces sp. H51]